jgi:hypothetical protein
MVLVVFAVVVMLGIFLTVLPRFITVVLPVFPPLSPVFLPVLLKISNSVSAVKLKLPALERNSSDSTRSDTDSGSILAASLTSTPCSVCENPGKTRKGK